MLSGDGVKTVDSSNIDILIVTALAEELAVLRTVLPPGKERSSSAETLHYYLAYLPAGAPGQSYTVAVTCLFSMGNPDAGILATEAIHDLNPSYIIMFGLAAGIKDKIALADVIVSTQIFYYEQAKLLPGQVEIRPLAFRADARLKMRMEDYATKTPRAYAVRFGPFAIGEKVVSNSETIQELKRYEPKLLGIEMESFGVAVAAHYALHRPRFIAVRGVSDFADEHKNDNVRLNALQNAADFLVGFLRTGALPVDRYRNGVEPDKTLIALHHLSLERRTTIAAAVETNLAEYQEYNLHELMIDQTDYFQNGSMVNPIAAFHRQQQFLSELDRLIQQIPGGELGYFGLAHIPFMMHLGYHVNRREVRVFATNRQTGEWIGLAHEHTEWPPLQVEGIPMSPVMTEGDVVLRISVSAFVYAESVQALIENPVVSAHLYLEKPDLDLVQTETQLNNYARIFRQTLSDITRFVPHTKRVHVFFAGPPTLAFRCGQQISKTMDPEVIIYNYSRRDIPTYRWSLNLYTGQIIDRGVISDKEQES